MPRFPQSIGRKINDFKNTLKTHAVSYIVLAAALIMALFTVYQMTLRTAEPAFESGNLLSFNTNWTDSEGNAVNPGDLTNIHDEGDEFRLTLHTTLPDHFAPRDSLMFASSNASVVATIDGRVVYENLLPESSFAGKPSGLLICNIPLDETYQGKTIELSLDKTYADSGALRSIYIGDEAAFMNQLMVYYLPPFLMSILILALALIFIVFSIALPRQLELRNGLMAFGLGALLVGLWGAEESQIPVIFFGNPDIWRMFNYPLLVLLPYPFVISVNELLNRPNKRYETIAFIVFVLEIALSTILWNTTGTDIREMRVLIHGTMGLAVLVIFLMLIKDQVTTPEEKRVRTFGALYLGFIIIILCMGLDMSRYYYMTAITYDFAAWTRVGFFIFELLMFTKYVLAVIQTMKTKVETDYYRNMAFKDGLTGIGNRAAFDKLETELDQRMQDDPELVVAVASLDLNSLKKINDGHGHALGDTYIKHCAEIVHATFAADGSVFRTGGDEFIAILACKDAAAKAEAAFKRIDRESALINSREDLPVEFSVACGWATSEETSERSMRSIEALADQRMYARKNQMGGAR